MQLVQEEIAVASGRFAYWSLATMIAATMVVDAPED
jgi:hypothetical protein